MPAKDLACPQACLISVGRTGVLTHGAVESRERIGSIQSQGKYPPSAAESRGKLGIAETKDIGLPFTTFLRVYKCLPSCFGYPG